MEAEHINRSDSDRKFTTSNYELTTTSSIEWKFSAVPESPPEGGFPKEQKILRAQVRGTCGCIEAVSNPMHKCRGLRGHLL